MYRTSSSSILTGVRGEYNNNIIPNRQARQPATPTGMEGVPVCVRPFVKPPPQRACPELIIDSPLLSSAKVWKAQYHTVQYSTPVNTSRNTRHRPKDTANSRQCPPPCPNIPLTSSASPCLFSFFLYFPPLFPTLHFLFHSPRLQASDDL